MELVAATFLVSIVRRVYDVSWEHLAKAQGNRKYPDDLLIE